MSDDAPALPAAIQSLEDLCAHLQFALELEHSTIPPYLAALYSIRPGSNADSSEIIRTVVVQEMLHMVLAANVLNAVGGAPSIDDPAFVPSYPAKLPVGRAGPIVVDIRKFSPEAIDTFLAIENPARPPAKMTEAKAALRLSLTGRAQLMSALRRGELYASIGDFYAAIEQGMRTLEARARDESKTIFTGCPARQIDNQYYYNAGGRVIRVSDLDSALEALSEIVDQGEGYGDTIDDADDVVFHQPSERAHYYRFNEIHHSRFYGPGDKPDSAPSGDPMQVDFGEGAVYPMIENPDPLKYVDPTLIAKSDAFSVAYTSLLRKIHDACNGSPEALIWAVDDMFTCRNLAVDLMRNPITDRAEHAGPCFRYVAPASGGRTVHVPLEED